MGRRRGHGWPRAGAAVAGVLCAGVAVSAQDTTALALRIGPALQAHTDLLASPFAQRGPGVAGALAWGRGGLSVELGAGNASTSSGEIGGVEDVWAGTLDLRYLRRAGVFVGAPLELGGALSAIASVRQHHYATGAGEFFADLVVPLSVSARSTRTLGERATLEQAAELSVASVLFRSPFAGAKTFPDASVSSPWETRVVRHRLELVRSVSARVRMGLSHQILYIASDRRRELRIVRQEVTGSLRVLLGRLP